MNPILATDYDGRDVTGWLMSEKLDGVRALWDGQKLVTRSGNEIHAPEWFLADLPKDFALDGELWGGRQTFQATNAAVMRKVPVDAEWRTIKFMAFDIVTNQWKYLYNARNLDLFEIGCGQFWEVIATIPLPDFCAIEPMLKYFQQIIANGGEGIILRDPRGTYRAGRSPGYLRLKPVTIVSECPVIGHNPNEYGDGLASISVLWRNEIIVKIGAGLTAEQRKNPPPIGSRVVFEYRGLTDSGQPRQPSLKNQNTQ